MRYRHLHRVRIALILCALLGGCATSPTGRHQLMLVSPDEMNSMGDQAFSQIKQKTPVSKDASINRYVHCVARHITALTPMSYHWQVTVFQSREVNAFALPGGNIGVYTGLFQYARNQGELAAVIGHEVGHVLARHADARVSTQMVANLGLQAADAAIGGSSSTHEMMMSALGLGTQVGVLLPYNRAQESEADLIGLDLMSEAGFDPRASIQLWKNMSQAGQQPPAFLSDHPSGATRISDLQSHLPQALESYQKARAAGKKPDCTR